MDFRPVNFKLQLCAGFLLAALLSAGAQSDQSIIFSAPADDSAAANPPDPSHFSGDNNLANQIQAPATIFNLPQPDNSLPSPSPVLSANEQRRLQKVLEDKKNWTLLTPEEIFGVTAPEKNPLTPEQQLKDKDLTPMERFLKRQEQSRLQAATNNIFGGNDPERWNPTQRPDGNRADASRANAVKPQSLWDKLLNSSPDNNPAPAQDNAGNWAKPFSFGTPPPAQNAAQNAAQVAEMERFREMLSPGRSSADKAAKTSPGGRFLFSTAPLPDPNMQVLPVVNPIGNSFTPLSSGIGRPTGIMPLPPITGMPVSAPATRPAWAPQPPPWLSQTPQPFVVPQRQF